MNTEPFVSYAQNFEDVMLWRALKHIQKGFYVDVGANDPKIDSVTQAFYERGWRGINIEPMQSYYEALCRERPEDINLPFAVAAAEREITLFEVPETGLSSGIFEFAQDAQSPGQAVVEHTVRALPLNKILEEHDHQPIHFLKIDVEGFEDEVIQGLDLSRWRPWIIVVEALIPNSSTVSYDSWEPILLSAEYIFVYFDGLNRFYVSKEHSELVESFAVPPNTFDHFITYSYASALPHVAYQDSVIKELNEKLKEYESNKKEMTALRSELEWERTELAYLRAELSSKRTEIANTRTELASTRTELDGTTAEIANTRVELTYARADLAGTRAELASKRNEGDELRAQLSASRAETENIRREYVNVLYSQSYRITAPLRALYVLLNKLRVNRPTNVQSQNLSPEFTKEIQNETSEDEKYFLNLFQHEIDKRRKSS